MPDLLVAVNPREILARKQEACKEVLAEQIEKKLRTGESLYPGVLSLNHAPELVKLGHETPRQESTSGITHSARVPAWRADCSVFLSV